MTDKGHPDHTAIPKGEDLVAVEASGELLTRAEEIAEPETLVGGHGHPEPNYPRYRVEPGESIDLSRTNPDDTGHFAGKEDAKEETTKQRHRLQALQERLYAENQQSLLIVLQATDTGGKDGTIRHVFDGVNPQGCRVWSFKQPNTTELEHDFLWRYHQHTPARGMIAIFNRSHYEDVLVVRVKGLAPEEVWQQRYAQINEFERMLTLNATFVLKFFLHISRDEQKRRLESRLETPDKRWKFNPEDLQERARWPAYQQAFAAALNQTATAYAPWYVIPANKKWYRNLVVARTVADTLEAMNPQFPADTNLNPEDYPIPD